MQLRTFQRRPEQRAVSAALLMFVAGLFMALVGATQAQACQSSAVLHRVAFHSVQNDAASRADRTAQRPSDGARTDSSVVTAREGVFLVHAVTGKPPEAGSIASGTTFAGEHEHVDLVSDFGRGAVPVPASFEKSPSPQPHAVCHECTCLCGFAILATSPSVADLPSRSRAMSSAAARIVGPSTLFEKPPRSSLPATAATA